MKFLDRKLNVDKTKANFKKVVWFYDFWGKITESKATRIALKFLEINDGQRIVEIACGTGAVFEEIAHLNPNGQNLGIDLSPDMLEKANQKLWKSGCSNFILKEGDILNLDIPDCSFDRLINNYMVDLMPQESFDGIASEFYRLLDYNGLAVISTFSFGTRKIHRFWYWLAKKMPDLLTGCRPVSFHEYLVNAGFIIENVVEISQNTFPSVVIQARKP